MRLLPTVGGFLSVLELDPTHTDTVAALEELRQLPGDRGRLPAAFLDKEEQKEFFDRKIADHRRKQSSKAPTDLDDFVSVMRMIDQLHLEGHKVEREDLVQAAMDGMLRWMDQHSNFLSGETYAKFFQDLEAEYGGIGAYVGLDPDTRIFSIVRPIYSGPAYEAGLKTDDKIVRIDDWPTLNQEVDDIIKRLKGQPGTSAKLYVWRHGMDPEWIERPTEEMAVVVERRRIEIPAGASQMLPGKIGLVELDTFSRKALTSLRRDITRMQKEGMRALILDMRRNSGGLLDQAREVSDLFLPPGKVVVTTEDRTGEPEVLKTRAEALVDKDLPIFVLTSDTFQPTTLVIPADVQIYGGFQADGLKQRVFEPTWTEPQRRAYTLQVAVIAAQLAGGGGVIDRGPLLDPIELPLGRSHRARGPVVAAEEVDDGALDPAAGEGGEGGAGIGVEAHGGRDEAEDAGLDEVVTTVGGGEVAGDAVHDVLDQGHIGENRLSLLVRENR